MKKAIFIDRDGTLIKDVNYLSDLKDVKFYKNTVKAIKLLKKYGYKIIVLTNQSGVARGYFTEDFVKRTHEYINKLLKKYNTKIDDFFYCPHYKDAVIKRYKKNCICRKPNIGMIKKAQKKYKIDLKKSYVIGDKLSDIKLGKNAKIKTILVLTGYGKKEKKNLKDMKPDYIAKDLYFAAKYIITKDGKNL